MVPRRPLVRNECNSAVARWSPVNFEGIHSSTSPILQSEYSLPTREAIPLDHLALTHELLMWYTPGTRLDVEEVFDGNHMQRILEQDLADGRWRVLSCQDFQHGDSISSERTAVEILTFALISKSATPTFADNISPMPHSLLYRYLLHERVWLRDWVVGLW